MKRLFSANVMKPSRSSNHSRAFIDQSATRFHSPPFSVLTRISLKVFKMDFIPLYGENCGVRADEKQRIVSEEAFARSNRCCHGFNCLCEAEFAHAMLSFFLLSIVQQLIVDLCNVYT
jgi:hypothetical protein